MPERCVLYLWLLLLIVGIGLMVLLWVGGLFVQGYIYTEPAPQVVWGAPAAGALLALFFTWWCYAVASAGDARPLDIPYDSIFRFSTDVEMVKEPVPELWAVKKNNEKVKYKRHRIDQIKYEYKDTSEAQRRWNGSGVVAIELEHDGEKYRFDEGKTTAGAFPFFVNEKGWQMTVTESRGPTGIPKIFRTGRFLANLFFNFTHLALWFVGLWLLMRFQWAHALGIGFCLWLLFTLAILPMMLGYAAQVAQSRPAAGIQSILAIHQTNV